MLPDGIASGTRKVFSSFAALLAICGMFLVGGAYVASFLFLQGMESSVVPHFDSAEKAVLDIKPAIELSSDAISSTAEGVKYVSSAMDNYSSATDGLHDSLETIALIPPFSLSDDFKDSVEELDSASELFSNASVSLKTASESAEEISESTEKISADLTKAAQSIRLSKVAFTGAIGMLNIAALIFSLALEIMFASVLLLSASSLMSHLPSQMHYGKNEKGPKAKPEDMEHQTKLIFEERDLDSLEREVSGEEEAGGREWVGDDEEEGDLEEVDDEEDESEDDRGSGGPGSPQIKKKSKKRKRRK